MVIEARPGYKALYGPSSKCRPFVIRLDKIPRRCHYVKALENLCSNDSASLIST